MDSTSLDPSPVMGINSQGTDSDPWYAWDQAWDVFGGWEDVDSKKCGRVIIGCELKPRRFDQTLKMQPSLSFTGDYARLP